MPRALEITEARLRLQGAGAAQPIWIVTRSGRLVYVNERWRAYFGLRVAPDSWSKWHALFAASDVAALIERFRAGLRGTDAFRLDCQVRRFDGASRWIQVNALPLRNADGSTGRFVCVNTDIHELKESDARVRAALEAASTGIWEWDVSTDAVRWTPECFEIHGVKEADFPGTGAAFFELVHPEDRARVQAAVQHAMEARKLYECEFRIVRPSGEVLWVENLGRATYDPEGRPVMVQGTLTDITERKRAEEAQRSREHALQTLADHSPDVISRFDHDLRHVFINASIERVTGLSRARFLGKTNRELGMPPENCDVWERTLRRVFDTGEPEKLEFSVDTLEGERIFQSRLVAERSGRGDVESVLVIASDVTERRRAESALRVSEERLQRAQAAARIGTWDWNVLTGEASWTDECWRLLGHEPFSRAASYEVWMESVHPEDKASAAEAVRIGLETGRYRDEFRVRYRDGSSARLEAEGQAFFVEGTAVRLVGTVRDITARHEAEEALRVANRRLLGARNSALLGRDIVASIAASSSTIQIVETLAEGLLRLGARGVACWEIAEQGASLLVERGLARSPEERARQPEEPPPAVRECARRGTSMHEPVDGSAGALPDREIFVSYVPLIYRPSTTTVVAVAHESQLDDERQAGLDQLCGQVAEALRRAELATRLMEQSKADRRLMAIVSHDLRNPLNTIALATSFLRSKAGDEALSLVQRIDRSTRAATSLVNDLLTFTRIEVGGLELSLSLTRVAPVLEACAGDASMRATGHRTVLLECDFADDLTLVLDGGRIQQAVSNLLSNALTYSRQGTTIVLRGSADEHALYIEVENEGSSLRPEDAAKIFEPLTRVGSVGETGSLGLGLFIVDRIVEAHHGRVWVDTLPPDRVRFCIQLPREPHLPAAEAVSLASRGTSQPPPAPSAFDADLHRLASHFRSNELRAVLELWAGARRGSQVPHPLALEPLQLRAYQPDSLTVNVSIDAQNRPVFHWGKLGARLERRLRGTLTGALVAGEGTSFESIQYAAYRRVWEFRECAYDYVHSRSGEGFTFERLLLPFSRDGGRSVTEILGIVLFK